MGTKWRNFRLHKLTKGMIFFLGIAFLSLAIAQLELAMLKKINPECLVVSKYHLSSMFYSEIDEAMRQVSLIAYYPKDLEKVNYYYYFSSGSSERTNCNRTDRAFYQQFERAFFYMEEGVWHSGEHSYYSNEFLHGLMANYSAYLAFPEDYMDAKQKQWDADRIALMPNAVVAAAGFLLSFLLILASCLATGRQPQDDKVHLCKLDHAYTEILLTAFLLGSGIFGWNLAHLLGEIINFGFYGNSYGVAIFRRFSATSSFLAIFLGGITALSCSALLFLFLSLLRKIKAGLFIPDSLLYRILRRLYRTLHELFSYLCYGELFAGKSLTINLYYRQMIFIIITILSVTAVAFAALRRQGWFVIPLLLLLMIIIWYTKGNKRIYETIEKSIRESTEEQMKSERMKVELITNVSHDLKTPLTSIISFLDLLSKEDQLSETAQDYVRILQDKSERLKNMVEDLFALAKSTSGEMQLKWDDIDLSKLIHQTLADMEDRIAASGLLFKLMLSEEPVYIHADGDKLYRVMQNIIDNALKYSMRGTRIYLELSSQDGRAVVAFKNIANYSMNFTAQEILQRFARGDESRSTEGNGLGLAIAESFTKACDGEFRIELEGDMFKVYLHFPQVIESGTKELIDKE